MTDYRLPSARATVGNWTIDRYQRLLAPQLIVSPVLFLFALFRWPNWLIIISEVAWFIFVGYRIGRRRGGRVETLVAGAVGGLFAGVATALGRWLADPSARWGVNVVTETLVTALIGALLATAAFVLVRRAFSKTPESIN